MSAPFNWKEFENLKGPALGFYTVNCTKCGDVPADCLQYFRTNSNRLDGQHLEMALFLLSKINTIEARHEIINYLVHPLQHIRLFVLGVLDNMESIDDHMLTKIRENLLSVTDEFEKSCLLCIEMKTQISKGAR